MQNAGIDEINFPSKEKKIVYFPQTTVSPKEQATKNSVLLILVCWFTYNINDLVVGY